jgi:hypothetical protein
MRICLLIPDGVGIRNYLYSDLLDILKKEGHQVVLWHSLDSGMIQLVEDRIGYKLEQYQFQHKPNGVLVQWLREAGRYARIRLNASKMDNPTILTNWSGASSSTKGKLLNRAAEWLGKQITTYKAIEIVELQGFRLISKSDEVADARKILEKIKPDLLFCTHQRVFSVTAAIEAAKSLGIPTSTAIFSWDNLPKGRLPFRVDRYLVWSQYMKDELLNYYPEIPENKIFITGSPQFDFYFKKDLLLSKIDFAKKYDLDPTKEWVCFSGCDTHTSPDDPKFLRDVAEELANESRIQLLFRPVPVETLDRFAEVLQSFPKVKLIPPKWVQGDHWGSFFPLFEDLQLLVNLAYHCKVVVNMGSTMALDFSVFGNVGLYLRYDHEGVRKDASVETIYQFQHFRSMGDWKAVGYIYSKKEILNQVKAALQHPDQVAPDRKLWFEKIVEPQPEKSAAHRVVEAFSSMTRSKF